MKLTFVRRELLAPGIWQHYFQPASRIDYVPGQYIDVSLPGAHADEHGMTRTFTITSLPGKSLTSFVTKDFEPASPYKQVLHALKQGGKAGSTDAMGDMVLPMYDQIPLIFVAGGIAIASYVSMLASLAASNERRDIRVLYAVRQPEDIIFREFWDTQLVDNKRLYVSPERITATHILEGADPDSLIYLSGSLHFVEDLRMQLHSRGIAQSRIVFDYYEGYTEKQI